MRVLEVASEAAPFAKTGGLADVAGALPQALGRLGVDVTLVIPAYREVFAKGLPIEPTGLEFDARIGSAALPGWDPAEIPRLGFLAAVVDRRLGRIPCCAPPEYPWDSDPTTWATLDLVA